MRRTLLVCFAVVFMLPLLHAKDPVSKPKIYIAPSEGFETFIIAGLEKKHDPVIIVTDEAEADYTLKATPVHIHQESTGSKIARCLFAYCAGIEASGNVAVQLIDDHTKSIVWGYTVTKGNGTRNKQSMAEAIAKHLNKDFLRKLNKT